MPIKIVLVEEQQWLLLLASRTIMAAASGNDHSLDGSLTNQAWFPLASVDSVLQLKESFLAVRAHIVRDRRTAQGNGFFEHFLDAGVKPWQFLASQRRSAAPGPD